MTIHNISLFTEKNTVDRHSWLAKMLNIRISEKFSMDHKTKIFQSAPVMLMSDNIAKRW
jgi:hypothetical protein